MSDMFEGYRPATFTEAIMAWDQIGKNVKCLHQEVVTDYGSDIEWKRDFKVNLAMIMDGQWFIEK